MTWRDARGIKLQTVLGKESRHQGNPSKALIEEMQRGGVKMYECYNAAESENILRLIGSNILTLAMNFVTQTGRV
ncbi:MAG: hypothetical protein WC780_08895 [Lentimicrobiaceae bacterium]|jgi:hypothetical protein